MESLPWQNAADYEEVTPYSKPKPIPHGCLPVALPLPLNTL